MAKIDTVLVSNFTFTPDSLTMNLGDSIEWVWVSGTHTTTSSSIPSGASSWDEPISSTSTSYLYVPSDTGTYEYVCTPHLPGMIAMFKVKQCIPTTFMDTATSCGPYQLNDSTYTASGHYRQILTNADGCDSILSLVLTIDTIDTDVTQNNDTLTVDEPNATYQWYSCDSGYTIIPSANSQSYTMLSSGHYAVVVTTANCVDTSDCVNYITVGLNEFQTKHSLKVFPNPSTGNFNVMLPQEVMHAQINVYNQMGQLIYAIEEFSGSKLNIDLSKFENGIYILGISENGLSKHMKIIKQ